MFKNMLLAIFIAISIIPLSALADKNESTPVNVSVLSITHGANNDVALLPVTDTISKKTENLAVQPQFHSAEKSQSALSTEWLFAVALFWFVILSNRRSV